MCHEAGQSALRFFIHNCIHLRILIISNLVTFLGTDSLYVLMCREAVNQSINQSINFIIITRHHVMIFTLLHHLSSVRSISYHSHSFSHLNALVCLILVTFSCRFLFYSQEIFSLMLDMFLVSLPLICVLITSGLSLILFTIPLLLT